MKNVKTINKPSQTGNSLAREKAVLCFMLIAVCWALLYGIIVKFTLGNSLLFALKTYVPEAMMLCSLLVAAFGGLLRGIDKRDVVLICLFGLSFCLGLAFDDTSNAPVLFRDVYIPVFFLLLAVRIDFSDDSIDWFFGALTCLMILYVAGSLALYYVEARNGYDWTARFYTGYSFWGQDPVSKIQINSNGRFMRLPALTGSSVKSAMYAVLALTLFLSNKKLKGFFRIMMIVAAFVCVAIFNNRSSLLAAVVLIAVALIRNISRGKGMALFLGIVIAVFGFAVLFFLQLGDGSALSLDSAFLRLEFWTGMFSEQGIANIILPVNVFSVSAGGSGIEGLNLTTDWDNGFLYILFAFGVPIFVLLLAFFVRQWKAAETNSQSATRVLYAMLCRDLLIASAVIALSSNIFQGRSWFFMFVLVYCVASRPISVSESSRACSGVEVSEHGL